MRSTNAWFFSLRRDAMQYKSTVSSLVRLSMLQWEQMCCGCRGYMSLAAVCLLYEFVDIDIGSAAVAAVGRRR